MSVNNVSTRLRIFSFTGVTGTQTRFTATKKSLVFINIAGGSGSSIQFYINSVSNNNLIFKYEGSGVDNAPGSGVATINDGESILEFGGTSINYRLTVVELE